VRFGEPDAAQTQRLIAQLDPHFPAPTYELNWLLCETLAFLQAPRTAAKALALIESAATQEEQMQYARDIRLLKAGWTTELRTRYFAWFLKAANYRGGRSFDKFIEIIRNDAVASLSAAEKTALADLLAKKPERKTALEASASALAGRTPTAWTLEELTAAANTGMKGRSFETGRKMFAVTGCFTCHRFGNEGGMSGPDLTLAGGRYNAHDLIDNILNPSREINTQFVPTVLTKQDGSQIIGTIVNLSNANVRVNTDPSDPSQFIEVDRTTVTSIEPSKVSMMPPGLLDLLSKDEVLDLVAYVLSGGVAKNAMFGK
jgi:putative heme-binding domain-containing protein